MLGVYVDDKLDKVREKLWLSVGTRLRSESRGHTNHRFSGAVMSLVDLLTQQLEVL